MHKHLYAILGSALLLAAPAAAFAQTSVQVGVEAGLTGEAGIGAQTAQSIEANVSVPVAATATVGAQGSITGQASSSSNTGAQGAASGMIASDENIRRVEFSSTSVSMTYPVRAHLLGLIPSTLMAEAEVKTSGEVELHYPWYRFLFSTDKAQIEAKLETVGKAASAYEDSSLTSEQRLEILSLMHAALQTNLEADASAEGQIN